MSTLLSFYFYSKQSFFLSPRKNQCTCILLLLSWPFRMLPGWMVLKSMHWKMKLRVHGSKKLVTSAFLGQFENMGGEIIKIVIFLMGGWCCIHETRLEKWLKMRPWDGWTHPKKVEGQEEMDMFFIYLLLIFIFDRKERLSLKEKKKKITTRRTVHSVNLKKE